MSPGRSLMRYRGTSRGPSAVARARRRARPGGGARVGAAAPLDVEPAASPEPPSGAEGFVLEEVEMRGFMRYVERTDPPLRFPEKCTGIPGRTGAGKSSILDA